jgi:RNA polymerase subunit RPABC4/transcription elongation factor Spt4
MSKTRKCKSCGAEISSKGKAVCPNCGLVHKKPFYKRWWFIVLVLLALIFAIPSTGSDDKNQSSTPTTENTEKKPSESSEQSASTEVEQEPTSTEIAEEIVANVIYDGVYKVGSDIDPGLYKVTVTDTMMNMAYIDRSKDASMDMDSIIANGILSNSGYVRIKETDSYVKVQGAELSPEDTIVKDIRTEFEDGIYLVGIDIEPGTYKVEVIDTVTGMGYVERLSDVSMEMNDIIANEIFQNQGYVEVAEGDFAVSIQGARITISE